MAKTPEQKRLERILSDEEYGPKLVRLNKSQERQVLDLIERNKSREARKLINQLDEQRRYHSNLVRRVRTYTKKNRVERARERPRDEPRDFWAIYDRNNF